MLLIALFDELPKKFNKKSFKGNNCSIGMYCEAV